MRQKRLHPLSGPRRSELSKCNGRMAHQIGLVQKFHQNTDRLFVFHITERHDDHFLPFDLLDERLRARWTLVPAKNPTGGPARMFTVGETGGRLGLISPLTHGFCAACNRVRLSCTGRLYPCLGRESATDLSGVLRHAESDGPVAAAILGALSHKIGGHSFAPGRQSVPAALRQRMNATGG